VPRARANQPRSEYRRFRGRQPRCRRWQRAQPPASHARAAARGHGPPYRFRSHRNHGRPSFRAQARRGSGLRPHLHRCRAQPRYSRALCRRLLPKRHLEIIRLFRIALGRPPDRPRNGHPCENLATGHRRPPLGLPAAATVAYLSQIMLARPRTLPTGFIAPCLPTKTDKLPSGGQWLHEIKHDGFRIIARKDGERERLYSRLGNDPTRRFPLIVDALYRLRSRSCIIDDEAVACDDNGIAPAVKREAEEDWTR